MKGAKKPRRVEEKTVFLLVRDGKIALRKRPGTGLLAGLWEFPNVEGALDEAAAGAAVSVWGLEPRRWESRLTAKHIFNPCGVAHDRLHPGGGGRRPGGLRLGRCRSPVGPGGALRLWAVLHGSGSTL